MAKARAIVKRRKAVRNIRKITRTMQMIATAKFQKSLKRAVATKPYALKIREIVRAVALATGGEVDHPLLRAVDPKSASKRVAFVMLTSNRGLAGGYNGNVIRTSLKFVQQLEAQGLTVDIHVAGKKGASYLAFQKRAIAARVPMSDPPKFSETDVLADQLMADFAAGKIDAVYVGFMNFISTGVQRPDVLPLLPVGALRDAIDNIAQQVSEKEEQSKRGAMDDKHIGVEATMAPPEIDDRTIFEFTPAPKELLDELIPLAVKTAFFQTYLDAATSEHVARMVSMKAATDNAEEMARALSLQYNRARQSQITTELSEIMGGVEAMKN